MHVGLQHFPQLEHRLSPGSCSIGLPARTRAIAKREVSGDCRHGRRDGSLRERMYISKFPTPSAEIIFLVNSIFVSRIIMRFVANCHLVK